MAQKSGHYRFLKIMFEQQDDISDLLEPLPKPKTDAGKKRRGDAGKTSSPVTSVSSSSSAPAPSVTPSDNSDMFSGLNPQLADKAKTLIDVLRSKGINAELRSGFRTMEQQQKLYSNRANNPYPVARPGTSKHEKRLAFDIVPTGERTPEIEKIIGEEGERLGLKWGGRFKRYDPVHFELVNVSGDDITDLLEEIPKGSGVVDVREVDDEPTQQTAPIEFESYKGEDLSVFSRTALGASQWASNQPEPKETNPNLLGNPLTLAIKSDGSRIPTLAELNQAMLNALGDSAKIANERYRQETGRDLIQVNVTPDELQNSYNPQTKSFELKTFPTQESIRIVNAYLAGGLDAAKAEAARITGERKEYNAELDKAANTTRGWSDTLKAGAADAVGATQQLAYNAATIPEAVFKGEYYGYDSPEYKALEKEDKRNQQAFNIARESLPQEDSTAKSVVRGLESGLVQFPFYANPAAPLVAFTANAHRGVKPATGEAVKMIAAGGGGQVTSGLTKNSSALTNQIAGRSTQGAIGAGGELLSGNTNPRKLAENFITNAAMPLGKNAKETNTPFGRVPRSIYDPATVRAPESSFTISKQMEALQNNSRHAVLITPGENLPSIPKGFETTETSAGTFIFDPKRIPESQIQKMVERNTFHRLMGIVENESAKTDRVVIAKDKETGEEIQAAYVSRSNQREQIESFKRQYPDAVIETGGLELESKVVNDRFKNTSDEQNIDESLNLRLEREELTEAQKREIIENEFAKDSQSKYEAVIDPDSSRIALLYREGEEPVNIEDGFVRVATREGVMDVNAEKAYDRFGIETVNDVRKFIKKNGVEPLIDDSGPAFQSNENNQAAVSNSSKIINSVLDIWNLPRAIRASYDFSAAGRQGLLLSVTHPLIALRSGWKQFKNFYKEENYENFKRELRTNREFGLAEDSGVFFGTSYEDAQLLKREEAFMSDTARKLPGIKQSERAYITYLDNLRLEVFSQYAKSLREDGITPETNPKAYKDIARFINFATGRGQGKLADAIAPVGNIFLWSPRNLVARFQTMNPVEYVRMDGAARKLAVKDLTKFVGTITTTLALASLAGADVSLDPDDSDFGKIRAGKTVYDITGGYQTALRYLLQTMMAAKREMAGEKPKPGKTPLQLATRFMRYQLQPAPAALINTATGKDAIGQKTTVSGEVVKLIAPMFLEDLVTGYMSEGIKGSLKAAPGLFGVGVQTFDKKGKSKEETSDKEKTNKRENLDDVRDLLEPIP